MESHIGDSLLSPTYDNRACWDSVSRAFGTPSLKHGDRIRIKDGYVDAGSVGYYVGKSRYVADEVLADFTGTASGCTAILAAAVEPYPYSREERIERATDDYAEQLYEMTRCDIPISDDDRALLYAILDAGV